jgi:hypothetical protein
MRAGTVHRVLARPGDALRPGSPLVEIRVDLGAERAQDCPPLFYFRLVATEKAHLRSVSAVPGQIVAVGDPLGLATTVPDEIVASASTRSLRMTSVAIQADPLPA